MTQRTPARFDRTAATLDFVGFADGEDLFEVMLAVDELEFTPLLDTERTEDHVGGAWVGDAEQLTGFGTE